MNFKPSFNDGFDGLEDSSNISTKFPFCRVVNKSIFIIEINFSFISRIDNRISLLSRYQISAIQAINDCDLCVSTPCLKKQV